jgi:hypothetical protein
MANLFVLPVTCNITITHNTQNLGSRYGADFMNFSLLARQLNTKLKIPLNCVGLSLVNSSQVKSSQVKSSRVESSQVKSSHGVYLS